MNFGPVLSKLLLVAIFFQNQSSLNALKIDPGKVLSKELSSSPTLLSAYKSSPAWLHWAYDYGGNVGGTVKYKEQVIGFKAASNKTVQALAKRNGAYNVLELESFIPAPFKGRVEVISSNSTLVIHDLQYNDSAYQFLSNIVVDVDVGSGSILIQIALKPNITVNVQGAPEFIKQPISTLIVNESSDLHLRIEMDGNPKPMAKFKWPHLTDSSPVNVPSVQLYPFVYASTYTLNKINASYCGRILQTTLRNNIGSSSVRNINITVLLKFPKYLDVKARKLKKEKCVEVKWKKVECGACYVRYLVTAKDSSGRALCFGEGYNLDGMMICSPEFLNITDVELMVSFKNASKSFATKVVEVISESPTMLPRTKKGVGTNIVIIIGASCGGLVALILIVASVRYWARRSKRNNQSENLCRSRLPRQNVMQRNPLTMNQQPRDPANAEFDTVMLNGREDEQSQQAGRRDLSEDDGFIIINDIHPELRTSALYTWI